MTNSGRLVAGIGEDRDNMHSVRVVVTGMGVISPVGQNVDAMMASLYAGRGGVRPIESFDASGMGTRIAAEVLDFLLVGRVGHGARAEEEERLEEGVREQVEHRRGHGA